MKSIDMVATALVTVPAPEAKAKPARKDTVIRTIKVDFGQSGALSELISRLIVQQRWAYNVAVEETLNDPTVSKFDLNNKLTAWRQKHDWLDGNVSVQRAGLAQGREAVLKFLESNTTKRARRIMWKDKSKKYRENKTEKNDKRLREDGDGAGANLSLTPWSGRKNRWSHESDLYRARGDRQALCVFGKPVQKDNNRIMLPGIGTVGVRGEMMEWGMRSFQLVETTKRITRRTRDRGRTYRLHVNVRIRKPRPVECDIVRGVDMGIVHNAATVDLDTGYTEFHDMPKDCRRSKNDEVSRMQAELSRKRGGSGNRRIRQNGKGGCPGNAGINGGTNGDGNGSNSKPGKSGKQCKTGGPNRINRKARRDRPRKPKSRSYKDLQRKIQKKREKAANRQTNWERHASKKIADGAGTVAIEDLNIKNMTARAKGRGSSAKSGLNREMAYSRPRMFLSQIEQTCKNMGVAVITVDPRGTSITCHRCGHKDGDSRISQAEFQCTNHDCECHINADVNAAHNIAVMATAGRRGLSSQGARFQAGIAPGHPVNNMRETSMGGIAGAPEKDDGSVTEVYNSLNRPQNNRSTRCPWEKTVRSVVRRSDPQRCQRQTPTIPTYLQNRDRLGTIRIWI